MKTKTYMKHSMSCLPDVEIEIEVDDELRMVRLGLSRFDSKLIGSLVTRVLPEEHRVEAYRDDSNKNESWLTKPATYKLLIDLAGTIYRAEVVRLFDSEEVAVTLVPGHG